MSEWREVTLAEVCERVTVGHVGKMIDEYVESGVPFLRSQNVKPFEIAAEGLLHISPAFHSRLKKSRLRENDVVVVRTGYPGTAAVVPDRYDDANCADLVVITPSAALNPHVLAAIFNSAWGRSSVSGQLVGSAQQHFNVGAAKRMTIRMPDRTSQDAIAEVLCDLNQSIETNRQQVAVLEEMARTIFREWFIRLRYPGSECVDLVESPLGPIPQGWETPQLFDVAEVTFGYPYKSKQFAAEGPFPIIRIRDVPKGTTSTFSSESAAARYRVMDGDVLIGMDGDFHLRQWTGGEAWLNQRVARLRPRSGMAAMHLMLALERPIRALNSAIVGTTVAHLGKRHLEQVRIALPAAGLLTRAASFFEHAAAQIAALLQANRRLVSMRDSLLPELLSGRTAVASLGARRFLEAQDA